MAGRKPLPVAVKKIKGTLQKRSTNPHEPRPGGLLGEPPEYMSDIAKETWRNALKNAPPIRGNRCLRSGLTGTPLGRKSLVEYQFDN